MRFFSGRKCSVFAKPEPEKFRRIALIWILGLSIVLCVAITPDAMAQDNPYESGLRALQAKEYDAAIKAFTLTLEIIPDDYEALSNRAVAWYYKKNYDRAIDDATQSLEINPYYSVGANQLAWMLATCPDPRYRDGERAVALAEKVVQRFPEANFMDTMAAAYAEAGNMEAAVRVQQKAVEHLKKEAVLGDKTSFENRLNAYDQAAAHNRENRDASSRTYGTAVVDVIKTPPSNNAETIAAVASSPSRPYKPQRKSQSNVSPPGHEAELRYTVHLFSFRQEGAAREKAAALAQGKHPAYICRAHIEGDPTPWFRVCVGAFTNDQAARQYARQQKEQGQDWAKAMPLPGGATRIGN